MFTSIFLKCGNCPCIVTDNLSEVQNYLKNTYEGEDCLYENGFIYFGQDELGRDIPNALHFQGKRIATWKNGEPFWYTYPSVLFVQGVYICLS